MRYSSRERFEANIQRNIRLAGNTLDVMVRLLEATSIEYEALDRGGVVAREPALAPIAADLVVACFLLVTNVADAHLYCCALHRLTEEQGVVFHFGTSVTGFKRIGTGIAVVETDSENVRADAFAVAAGSYSYLNTGHGHLRWSMSAGSGKAAADLIAGKEPENAVAD